MPDLLMTTEAASLFGPGFATPRARRCRADRVFQVWAEMQGVDVNQLGPAVLYVAVERCRRYACRKACRRWVRTGVFQYAGDPRCPNAVLLHH